MISTSIRCSCCNTSQFLTFNIMTYLLLLVVIAIELGIVAAHAEMVSGNPILRLAVYCCFYSSALDVSLFSHIWHLRCRHSKIRILFAEKSSSKILHTRFTGLRSFHGEIKKVRWNTRVPCRRVKKHICSKFKRRNGLNALQIIIRESYFIWKGEAFSACMSSTQSRINWNIAVHFHLGQSKKIASFIGCH